MNTSILLTMMNDHDLAVRKRGYISLLNHLSGNHFDRQFVMQHFDFQTLFNEIRGWAAGNDTQ